MRSRKILFCAIILITSSQLMLAQSLWKPQFTASANLNAIQMFRLDSGDIVGYVVGNNNFVGKLTLTDSSYSLKPLEISGNTEDLNTLFFTDPSTGWVVGSNGAVFFTPDSGKSWVGRNPAPKRFSANLHAVYFFDFSGSQAGWVGGSNGEIWLKPDNVMNWSLNNTTCDEDTIIKTVFGIEFFTTSTGYCVTRDGGIFRKSNLTGCWIAEPSGTTDWLHDISLVSKTAGWIAGTGGTILRSTSLPEGWTDRAPPGLTTIFNGISALSLDTAFVVGNEGLLLQTTDGGTKWDTTQFGVVNLNKVFALDRDNIWIVGDHGTNYYSEGTIKFVDDPLPGNREVETGTEINISFVTEFNSSVNIVYSVNGGNSWIADTTNLEARYGSYSWRVPDTVSTNCFLRIQSSQSSKKSGVYVTSDMFKIFRKTLKLKKPAQDTTLTGGKKARIEWMHENVKLINVRFQRRPNAPLEFIDDSVSANNEFFDQWIVPRIKTDRSRIVIFETDGSPIDTSGAFAIKSDTSAPKFIKVTVGEPEIRDTLMITATIRDDNPTINKLFFRPGGDKTYAVSLLMDSVATDQYRAKIPAEKVTLRGIEYYINSVDTSPDSLSAFWGKAKSPMPIRTLLKSDTTRNVARSQPGADAKYRKISLPYEIDNASISDNFTDNFGGIDKTKWGIWFWSSQTQQYIDFTGTEEFDQGTSFWLAADFDAFNTGRGQSYKAESYPILLRPEWNQIGHPFAFPVLVQDVLDSNATLPANTQFYSFENENIGWDTVLVLEPWKGYFIKNTSTTDGNLTIPAIASSSSPHRAAKTHPQKFTWRIKVLAKVDRRTDANNYAGISEQAAGEWDLLDLPEPPPAPGNYISLYFPHKDWERFPDIYTTDFRPPVDNGAIWDFVIQSNIALTVAEVEFRWIKFIPEEFRVVLIDEKLDISQNLRQNPFYYFTTGSQPIQRKLKLIVGKEDFFSQNDLQLNTIPSNFELSQNFPNPFNPATTILYGLPKTDTVTLKVFNLLGEEVVTLVNDEEKTAGYHIATWKGQNKNGQSVASGIYIYRLSAGSFTMAKKMITVK